jgi:hypothetical protein
MIDSPKKADLLANAATSASSYTNPAVTEVTTKDTPLSNPEDSG